MMTDATTQRHCQLCGNPIPNPLAKQYCSITCRNRALGHKNHLGAKPKPPIKNPRWTLEQEQYVLAHYAEDGAAQVAAVLGFTHDRVIQKANRWRLPLNKGTRQRIAREINGERMRQSNPMHNPKSKSKMLKWWDENPDKAKERADNFLAGKQQSQRNKPNKLEIKTRGILESTGVTFEAYALIKPNFIVDFRIGQTIVQIDGEYWHGHPRFEPLTDRQKRQRRRDKAQDKYLIACGYKVIRIWERDITDERVRGILKKHGLL